MSMLAAVTLFWVLPALVTLLACMLSFGTVNVYQEWDGKLSKCVILDLTLYSAFYPITWVVSFFWVADEMGGRLIDRLNGRDYV